MTKYNLEGFEGLLTITSLEAEDSGVYSCVAIQETTLVEDCSHTQTHNITLNINCKYFLYMIILVLLFSHPKEIY